MFLFSVKSTANTASFRVPETHTFHQTLPLPPKTTIIGMMGAALGLNLKEAHDYAEQNKILFGVYGSHKGVMKDLWNYRKITGKEKKYSEDQVKNRLHYSVLIREFLCFNEFYFYFGSGNYEALEQLKEAIHTPVYALTAGNSDDLLKICKISEIFTGIADNLHKFENTIIPGDISKNYKPSIDWKELPIVQTIYTPQVFLLPTRFEFSDDERRVIERKPFTFVSTPIETERSVEGYVINGISVVLQ